MAGEGGLYGPKVAPPVTPYIVEPILFGRDTQKNSTVECIVNGEYSENKLTVLLIVGPGGRKDNFHTTHIPRAEEPF